MKKIFVLGGTGLLGLQTIHMLLERNYEVATIARNSKVMSELLPEQVTQRTVADINEMPDDEVLKMLEGTYAFMYAAGLDERTLPEAPAARFYYEQNVLPTQRLANLARRAGVKKFVIYGSYHIHSAELWPELELDEQPYVETRRLQEKIAMLEGEGEMDVMSLRLPYIFGTIPHRTPLWKSFFPSVKGEEHVEVPLGGTAMVTTKQVAEAAVCAMEHGEHRGTYAISGINMKYKEFYQMIADSLGQHNTVIEPVSVEKLKPNAVETDEKIKSSGKEFAIHMAKQTELQGKDVFIDPKETMSILGYEEDDVREEIRKTLKVCARDVQ